MAEESQSKPPAKLQTFSYQGIIPPPDMMEQFKKVGTDFPERIVRMAEMSLEKTFKEIEICNRDLEISRETLLARLDNEKADLNTKQHEAETKRIALSDDARYNFRAQVIILVMVLSVLASAILLGMLGLSGIAYVVVGGGFATIIIAAIKGVSVKPKK
ncbi:MAG: hypothetical protein LBH25_15335 [Fibromonadaceae bacterium]|jgi:hypothetical protein|nr:hypothetical protein [Fibromonadaceae bacterium]